MRYAGKVYSGELYIGNINANSMRGLTRRASTMCNRYFKSVDTVILHKVDGKEAELKFTRRNQVSPDNTIIRGKWQ